MRLLYLYPEEWTSRRAREVHTLSTCVALAQNGVDVTLITAGGLPDLQGQLQDVAGRNEEPGLRIVALSRSFGPIRSAALFDFYFRSWLARESRFDAGFAIHLKAAGMLARVPLPYLYEAHEIFAETPQKDPDQQQRLHELEKQTLTNAAWRVATSKALAEALANRYELPRDFAVIPNAGPTPLERSVASPSGPLIYSGSIADWKGLELVIEATREAGLPLKIIGGSESEWHRLCEGKRTDHVRWIPRVPLANLPEAMAGGRAGLIPTQPETPSGRYSCPMKLFDYARCGLPVLSTALPSLQSLHVGSWCTLVETPSQEIWAEALRNFHPSPVHAETARAWAGVHTWTQRAVALNRLLAKKPGMSIS